MTGGDDPLLRALGRAAAEEEELSPDEELLARWCAGTLEEHERRALEARAAVEPTLARGLAAHRPLGETSRAALVDRLLAARRAEAAANDGGVRVLERGKARVPPAARGWRWGGVGVPLVLAAALLLWIGTKTEPDAPAPREVATLPAYELDAAGGDRDTRGPAATSTADSQSARLLRPTSRLTLTVRPATTVEGAVIVEAFVRPRSPEREMPGAGAPAELVPLPLAFAVSSAGTAHLSARAQELFGERRGPWELRLVVARAGTSAAERRALANGSASSGPGWQRLGLDLLLVDGS